MEPSKPTNSIHKLKAFIASQQKKYNAYLEHEQRLKDAGQEYDPGAGFALFLFIAIWIIGITFGEPP